LYLGDDRFAIEWDTVMPKEGIVVKEGDLIDKRSVVLVDTD
jgi:hypothetical protein